MAEPLKYLYNPRFFDEFCKILKNELPGFQSNRFLNMVNDEDWGGRELKDRMKHIRLVLSDFLSDDFEEAVDQITRIIDGILKSPLTDCRLEFMFLPDYVEKHGMEHLEVSLEAMEKITQFTSCEFAIRPFIAEHGDRLIEQLLRWTNHKSHHVRRLASEGCRPRLPWAMALPEFKKNPEPILPVLENLKGDPSEYVRRSVANNLNDIAKDHPELVLKICNRWIGQNTQTDRLVKHACRTLLKKAHPGALALFGFHEPKGIEVQNLTSTEAIQIGDKLEFSFQLANRSGSSQNLRVEYGIDYRKANGKSSRKIFQITENRLDAGQAIEFQRTQSFQNMTTRRHYPGDHKLAILVNGRQLAESVFIVSG